ncbi:retrovirus-related pol polyprotein from transposon TNT 1-94 [Tanacetum coccineum]|uniref:Retrovirus-related pol polyprotein from transposon TNT 1-94 n=1 Tax=Tanacetum coccineum TaxID=301880 RepID=A0ABQ4WE38_9ASTR
MCLTMSKNTFEEPDDTQELTDEQKKDLKQKRSRNADVLSMIQWGVTPLIFPKIMRLKKAKETWEVLKQEFQGDVKVKAIKLQTLRRDYENTKMKENESLNDYSSRLTDLINRIKTTDDTSLQQGDRECISIRLARRKKTTTEFWKREFILKWSRRQSFGGPGHGQSYRSFRGRSNFDKRSFGDGNSNKCSICKKDNHEEKDCWHKGKFEPESFEEAIREKSWKKAMEDEIQVIEKNNTWELTNTPSDKDVIGVKWVYKVKFNADGSVERNKARLVAKGYSQQPRIKYDETFAAVARMDMVQAIISLEVIKVGYFTNSTSSQRFRTMNSKKKFIMEIYQDDGGVFICQEKYVEKILKNFDMSECKSKDSTLVVNEKLMKEDGSSKVDATLYRSLVRKLLYLTTTRPDIMFAASLLSSDWGKVHLDIVFHLVQVCLVGAQRSSKRIFEDIGEKQMKPTTIFCDSMSAIAIAKNPVHHSRTSISL